MQAFSSPGQYHFPSPSQTPLPQLRTLTPTPCPLPGTLSPAYALIPPSAPCLSPAESVPPNSQIDTPGLTPQPRAHERSVVCWCGHVVVSRLFLTDRVNYDFTA